MGERNLVQGFEKFIQAHDLYKDSLTDEDDLEKCMGYIHKAEI